MHRSFAGQGFVGTDSTPGTVPGAGSPRTRRPDVPFPSSTQAGQRQACDGWQWPRVRAVDIQDQVWWTRKLQRKDGAGPKHRCMHQGTARGPGCRRHQAAACSPGRRQAVRSDFRCRERGTRRRPGRGRAALGADGQHHLRPAPTRGPRRAQTTAWRHGAQQTPGDSSVNSEDTI